MLYLLGLEHSASARRMSAQNRLSIPGVWWPSLLLVAITLIAYQPVWHCGFVWDDFQYVVNNPTLRSVEGLRKIWVQPGATVQYYPLTFTSFWLEYHLWGLNPLGYHLVNVVLHSANAILFGLVLKRLKVPGAWLAAAIFALHPVCVESVAWVTERKNTLSGLFFLGSTLAALEFWLPNEAAVAGGKDASNKAASGLGKRGYYWLALGFYVCALASKTAAVPLPVVILLLLWWKRGGVRLRDVLALLPFLMAGLAMGLVTMRVEHTLGASGEGYGFSPLERCVIAGKDLWFYFYKLCWPHPLMFVYPRWRLDTLKLTVLAPLCATLGGTFILWRIRQGWGRSVLCALGYFAALLFPVLGFFNVFYFRYSFVADHFQYLASLGPIALFAAGIAALLNTHTRRWRAAELAVAAGISVLLGTLSWQQSQTYADPQTLWKATLTRNPDSFIAHLNYGTLLLGQGRDDEAMLHFQEVLKLQPDDALAHNNVGIVLLKQGHTDEAVAQFQKAIMLQPSNAEANENLGRVLLQRGEFNAAAVHFGVAVKSRPRSPQAHNNLGYALLRKGEFAQASASFERALEIQSDYVPALNNLAWVLATAPDDSLRNGARAVELAQQANHLSSRPNPVGLQALAAAYAEIGRFADAVDTARAASRMAVAQGNFEMSLEDQIKCYESKQPFRDTAPPQTDR